MKNIKPPEDVQKSPEIDEADLPEDTFEEWEYTPSCTAGDYGPGNPWDAPGMSIHDFI